MRSLVVGGGIILGLAGVGMLSPITKLPLGLNTISAWLLTDVHPVNVESRLVWASLTVRNFAEIIQHPLGSFRVPYLYDVARPAKKKF